MSNKKEIINLIRICEDALDQNLSDSGIFTGSAGMALYYFEKNKRYQEVESKLKLESYIEKSIDSLSHSKDFSLCSGNMGVYYLLIHLIKNQYVDEKIEDYFEDFLEYADDLLEYYRDKHNFDFLHGYLGILFIYTELYTSITDPIFKSKVTSRIIIIVKLLDYTSVHIDEYKIAWVSKGLNSKVEGYSFGLAHGIPSVISLLTRVYRMNIETENIKTILDKAANYMLSVKGNYKDALFPALISIDGDKLTASESSRLAWCNGDLSVGISLLNYAIATKNSLLIDEASDILLNTTSRHYENSGVNDIYLCHGTIGLAIIYNYLYKVTGNANYHIESDFWLRDTIRLSKLQEPNIKTWLGSEGWIDHDSILEGKSGLILALYTFLDKDYINPLDKLFLLDYEN